MRFIWSILSLDVVIMLNCNLSSFIFLFHVLLCFHLVNVNFFLLFPWIIRKYYFSSLASLAKLLKFDKIRRLRRKSLRLKRISKLFFWMGYSLVLFFFSEMGVQLPNLLVRKTVNEPGFSILSQASITHSPHLFVTQNYLCLIVNLAFLVFELLMF